MVAEGGGAVVVVREYEEKKDCKAVEEMENGCEVGPSGKLSLYTDLLGDPICRVRNSPAYLMLASILFLLYVIFSAFIYADMWVYFRWRRWGWAAEKERSWGR